LAQSEALLRSFFDSSGLLCGVVEIEGDDIRYISVNAAMAAMYGLTPEAVANKRASEISTDRGIVKLFVDNYRKSQENNVPSYFEYRRQVGSEMRWFYVTVTFLGLEPNSGHPRYAFVTSDITERRRAEEAIRLKEEFYRRLIEKAPDAILVIDAQGTMHYASPSMPRLLGYGEDERIGESAFDFVHPDDVGKVVELFAAAAATPGASDQVETRVKHKDGSWRWVQAVGTNHLDDPAVHGIVINLRDITERKNADELLTASEERYRLLAENVSDVIWLTNLHLEYLYVSPSIERLMGFTPEEFMAMTWSQAISKESLEIATKRLVAELELEKAGGADPDRVVTMELEVKKKDGFWMWTEVKITFMRDNDGKAIGLLGMTRDISERKRLEDKLRESELKLRTVVGSITDGLIITDMTGMITDANEAAVRIGKHESVEEWQGRNGLDFVEESDRKRIAKIVIATIKDPERLHSDFFEYTAKNKDGTPFYGESSIAVIRDSSGKPTGIVFVTRDISERKRLERDLRKALDDLQRSNKDLEQFVYVASHDMQEPLRMISSYTQLLGKRYKGKLDSDADEFIGFAVDGASRMQKMINDLLIFSRVTTRGKDFEPVDLEKVLSDAIDNLKIAIEENKATITHDPLPKVMADEPQMVRLLQNIIGNAIKFHGQEPPIIHVSAKEGTEEWAISVKDNGIGIDKKFFDHLFIVFQRLHTRDQYPGTGIGLAVCKKTVERHGGRIWVESEGEGKGSAFTFTLPKRALTKKVETAKSLQENDQENDYEKKEDKK
jgi:PAS domain S-box-containing protein